MSCLLRSLEKMAEEVHSMKLVVRLGGVKLDDITCIIQKLGDRKKLDYGYKFPEFGWNRRCSCCGYGVWERIGRIGESDTDLVDFLWCNVDGTGRWV